MMEGSKDSLKPRKIERLSSGKVKVELSHLDTKMYLIHQTSEKYLSSI